MDRLYYKQKHKMRSLKDKGKLILITRCGFNHLGKVDMHCEYISVFKNGNVNGYWILASVSLSSMAVNSLWFEADIEDCKFKKRRDALKR